MNHLALKNQEIPFDDPRSNYTFSPQASKPFVATSHAVAVFGESTILARLRELQALARAHNGLDYLQVFTSNGNGADLWFIEDDDGGAITALLPEDY